MTEPVTIAIGLDDFRKLLRLAQVLAEDLASEIDAKYPGRADQPVQSRRHNRDMNDVRQMLLLLHELKRLDPEISL